MTIEFDQHVTGSIVIGNYIMSTHKIDQFPNASKFLREHFVGQPFARRSPINAFIASTVSIRLLPSFAERQTPTV